MANSLWRIKKSNLLLIIVLFCLPAMEMLMGNTPHPNGAVTGIVTCEVTETKDGKPVPFVKMSYDFSGLGADTSRHSPLPSQMTGPIGAGWERVLSYRSQLYVVVVQIFQEAASGKVVGQSGIYEVSEVVLDGSNKQPGIAAKRVAVASRNNLRAGDAIKLAYSDPKNTHRISCEATLSKN